MSIRVQCQFCGRVSLVDDSRAGQFIDCPNCRAELTVPNPKEKRQLDAAFRLDGESDAGESSTPPSDPLWAWTLGLFAIFAVLGFVGAFIASHLPRNAARPKPRPGPVPAAAAQNPPIANWRPRPAGGRGAPAVARNWRQIQGDPRFDGEGAPLRPVPWKVATDPPAVNPTIPPNHAVRIPIPDGPNPEIVFPATPSTMVSVGNVGHGRELREIWDFRDRRRIGSTRGLRTLSEHLGGFFRPISALSADGRFFATHGLSPLELVVWDVSAERQLGIVEPQHAPSCSLTFAAFARPDRLLASGFGTPFQKLGVVSAEQVRFRRFPREREFDRSSLALSPGGRYLAVFDKSRLLLRFYDIESAAPAGQLPLPPFEPAGPMNCECVAFSPDGREVAAMFFYNSNHHLACWDLTAGKLVDRVDFGGNLRAILGAPFAYLFTPLEWFPGQARWLVYGQGIVDRHAGKLIWTIPDEPNRYRYGLRHVAGDDCVLSVVNEGSKFVLASVQLPLAEIDRAAQSPAGTKESSSK
jgi:hypothetical protein